MKVSILCTGRNEYSEDGKERRALNFSILTDTQVSILTDDELKAAQFDLDYEAQFRIQCEPEAFRTFELNKLYTMTIE